MTFNFKKLLLAGTALVAVSAASTQVQAAAFTNTATAITSGASGTWALTTAGVQANATHADIAHAGAGDTVNLAAGATLTVSNAGVAADGSADVNTFVLGAVTNTAGTGAITVVNGAAAPLTVTIASANVGGAVSFASTNAAAEVDAFTVTGDLVGGSTLAVDNSAQATAATAMTLGVGGNLNITGTTAVKGGAFAGAATTALTVTGNSQFTGAVTVTGGANAAATSVINLNGATNVAAGGITLTNGVAGHAGLNFTGTAAQTESGNIAGTGDLQVKNASGVTFTGTVAPATITIDKGVGNSSATFKNTVTSAITLGAAAGTVNGVTFGAATAGDVNTVTFDSSTQSFTVTGAIAGQGAVQTNNVAVIGGKTVTLASASTSNLNNISVSGTNTVAAAADNLQATTLTVGTGGTLQMTGAAKTIVGTITNTGGTIWDSADANNQLTTAFTNTGTLAVGSTAITATRTLTLAGGMADASTGTVKIFMNGAFFGKVAEGAGAVDLSHQTVEIAGTNITAGTYSVFTGTAGTGVVPLSLQSAFYTVTSAVNGAGVDITVAAKTLTGNEALATSILASGAMQTAIGANALANIKNSGSSAELDTALSYVQPTVDGSATQAAFDSGEAVHGVADTRMASLRNGDGLSGMAAGSSANGVSMWLQGYGQSADQRARGGIAGYSADTLGGAIGVDSTHIMNDGVLGFVFNYGRTGADSKNATTTSTDVDNYGFGIYGTHDLGSAMFVNGQVGYAYNKINSTRHNVGAPGSGLVANASYNSDLYSAKLALGRDYAMDHGLTLTPTVSAEYSYLSNGSYSETGTAGGLLMNVNSNNVSNFNLGLGVNAGWKFKNSDGSTAKPSLHANYTYDATDSKLQTNAVYQGAVNNTFSTSGPTPSRSALALGAGIVYSTTANWDLSANYDYTWKEQYGAHSGMLRATSHF